MKTFRKILCEIFDYHKPIDNISVEDKHVSSICKYCGRRITRSIKGRWFSF